jgi:hypothetical protein
MLPATYHNTRCHYSEDHNTKLRSLKNFKILVRTHLLRQAHITDLFRASKRIQLRKTEKDLDKCIARR